MNTQEIDAINTAAQALGLGLAGMTWDRWQRLSALEKTKLVDESCLTKQLKGYENCRVEVIDKYRNRRRFWVGKSTGWQPIHLEIKTKRSRGGTAADHEYQSVMIVRNRNGDWMR